MSTDLLESKRPRGRPRVEEPKQRVSAWVPVRHQDALIRMANRGDKSVSKLLGELVAKAVEPRDR